MGVHGHAEAAKIAYLGLYALQHRGQESAGICSGHGGEHFAHRAMGLVSEIFDEALLAKLPGRHAIGHVRYSTAGESQVRNAQPICANTDVGPVAVAHNGNIVNAMRHLDRFLDLVAEAGHEIVQEFEPRTTPILRGKGRSGWNRYR